jgi:hypothetical protein
MYAKSNYPRGGFGGRAATRSGQKAGDEHKGYGPVYDEAGSCLKVFIGGLGHDVTEESFRAFFEQARSQAPSRASSLLAAAAAPLTPPLTPPLPGLPRPSTFSGLAALAPRRAPQPPKVPTRAAAPVS